MMALIVLLSAVDARQLGVAAVGGGRQVALERTQAAAVGRGAVAQPSPAQAAARQAQRVPAHAARTGKVLNTHSSCLCLKCEP